MIAMIKKMILKIINSIVYSNGILFPFVLSKKANLENVWPYKNPKLYDKSILKDGRGIDLSIIIPLYNSSKYIDKLANMWLSQKTEYKYEIIFVNDGSCDSTLELINSYGKRYPGLFKVLSKENSGISDSRNAGLKLCSGKFVGFMDHDDEIESNYVESLLNAAYCFNADIVKCTIAVKDVHGATVEKIQEYDATFEEGSREDMLSLSGYIWGGLYSRKLFTNLRFPESYWYEDMITRFLIYSRSNKTINITNTTYTKFEHDDNASKKIWSSKNYKCLEQFYLFKSIILSMADFEMNMSLYIFKIILDEASGTTVYRISKMKPIIKKTVFLELKKLVLNSFDESFYVKLDKKQKAILDIFKNDQYYKWLLLQYID